GFKDFWETAYNEFPHFFGCVASLTALINKIRKAPVEGVPARVIHSMACLVSNSFGSLLILALNGYGHDAMRVTRSMFEILVNAKYIELRPTEAQDYVDFHWVRKYKTYEYFKKHSPESLDSMPQQKVDELLAKVQEVRPRFENANGKLREAWC